MKTPGCFITESMAALAEVGADDKTVVLSRKELKEDAQSDQDFIRGVRSQLQDLSMKCHHYHPTAPEAKKELLKVEALLDQARKILFDIQ